MKCFSNNNIIDTKCRFVIEIFMNSAYTLVAKMIETMECNSSSTSDQMDLTDVLGFKCLVMVLRVIMNQCSVQKKMVLINKLSRYAYIHRVQHKHISYFTMLVMLYVCSFVITPCELCHSVT